MQPMTINEVAGGPAIPPAARVQLMDDQAFEALVRAWMARLEHRYKGIERFGGPGDMGRDVIGWETDNKCLGPWDNVRPDAQARCGLDTCTTAPAGARRRGVAFAGHHGFF
jgi:hypothetical protein